MSELDTRGYVLAPGGSIVLSGDLMAHLKKTSLLIFLNVSFKTIQARLEDGQNRGIIGLKSKSLKEVFDERMSLYRKYAQITINCSNKSSQEIVEEIIRKTRKK